MSVCLSVCLSVSLGLLIKMMCLFNKFMDTRVFTHGAMGRRIDPSWGGPIELFLVPASAPRLV